MYRFSKMHEHRYFYLERTTNGRNYYQMNKTTQFNEQYDVLNKIAVHLANAGRWVQKLHQQHLQCTIAELLEYELY